MTDKAKGKGQEQPTNGGTPPDEPEAQTDEEVQDEQQQLHLSPEMEWLRPHFSVPVIVQTTVPLWRVKPRAALLAQGPDGKPGALGVPEMLTDAKGEPMAVDYFDNAVIQPSHCGTRVVIMQKIDEGHGGDQGQALYTISPDQIQCISQVIPTEEQVQREIDRLKGGQIVVPGAPGNQPGKIIT